MKFKDNKGREWFIEFTIGTAREIKKRLDVDLMETEKALVQLSENDFALMDATWLAIEGQAKTQGVDTKEFENSLGGKEIEAITTAFIEALINFTPSQATKAALKKTLAAMTEAEAELTEAIKKISFGETLADGA